MRLETSTVSGTAGRAGTGEGRISWVQHFTLPPPLSSSLRSTEIGQ